MNASTDGQRTVAILVGGGPAPGLNGVINAVVLAGESRGWRVLGVPEGFRYLMKGDVSHVRVLDRRAVEGIETRGGSILYTSRANPQKDPEALKRVVACLQELGVTDLVTLGGDDTATSAIKVAEASKGQLRVAHVPKTIDNDLPLPGGAPTFGFETAKALGSRLCVNLREDARTTRRWVIVTAMGRTAGHLALGMGVSSGADLTVIPEEFDGNVDLGTISDLCEAAIVKRISHGEPWGLVILAEGLLDLLGEGDFAHVGNLERDEHGHPRLSEVSLGRIVKDVLAPRFKERGLDVAIIAKEIGYELRCADPVAFDVQYTRTLGVGAVDFLETGKGNAMIALQDGKLAPLGFEDLRDAKTGRVRVRGVDVRGATFTHARHIQARLTGRDFSDEGRLGLLSAAAHLEPSGFKRRFERLSRFGE
ncbi:MAG: 6-phosphofructokinase [Euryarchaeota archaeon]|nr:6-phosphofructokinase [Euryarchaeota archaeon]